MAADVTRMLHRVGGVASYAELRPHVSRRTLEAALDRGLIVRDARGRYAVPTAEEGRRAAHRLSAVAGGRTAAAIWGWKLKEQPSRPEVVVPRGRRVPPEQQARLSVRWRSLLPSDVVGGRVTSPLRTVLDCATALPFDEALAVADSALRSGRVSREELREAAGGVAGRGRRSALRVAAHADGRAANPFESVLRALSLDVPGLELCPQVPIRLGDRTIHPDLADRRLRIVVEADSYEFHTTRWQIDQDCWRYDELVLDGWLVLRFSWPQVMTRAEWVRGVLQRAVCTQTTIGRLPGAG